MTKPGNSEGEVVVLCEAGEIWKELRIRLTEGLTTGEIEFVSPGLWPFGWVLAILGSRLSLRRVGTLGASWKEFESEERVQLWIPGNLTVPAGVVVQVAFAEGP